MDTKAYNYNRAVKDLAEGVELTEDQVRTYLAAENKEAEDGIEYNKIEDALENTIGRYKCWFPLAIKATQDITATKAYPYLSDVASKLLELLGVDNTYLTQSRAQHIVYGTNQHMRQVETITLYERMIADGYVSIHDIKPEDNGKSALLRGSTEQDWLTRKHEDEKVRLVCVGEGGVRKLGYQKAKQRTKYYVVMIDGDLFVKII